VYFPFSIFYRPNTTWQLTRSPDRQHKQVILEGSIRFKDESLVDSIFFMSHPSHGSAVADRRGSGAAHSDRETSTMDLPPAWCQVCICGRTFSMQQAYTYHKRSCQKTKKRLAGALEKAKEVWQTNKRRKTEAKAARGALELESPLHLNTLPVAIAESTTPGASLEVRFTSMFCSDIFAISNNPPCIRGQSILQLWMLKT
jgi:hypothetical protein